MGARPARNRAGLVAPVVAITPSSLASSGVMRVSKPRSPTGSRSLPEIVFVIQKISPPPAPPASRAMLDADAPTAELHDWVRIVVDSRPDMPRPHGIAYAARQLGLSRSRARGHFYGLVPAALAREWVEARARFEAWVELELARTEASNAIKRARLEAARGSRGS